MLKHISVLSLLGVVALGAVAVPAHADTAIVQQGTQDIYIQGDGNAAVQSSQQVNRMYRDRAGRQIESTGVVQDIYQGGTVVGEGNGVYQESSQVNVIQERVRPGHNNGHRPNRSVEIRQR
jgi:flagellar basal body rod protein FlgF